MKFSQIPAIFLRSPWHWLMGPGTMLVALTGRKTGRSLEVPVNFYRDGAQVWVVSSRDRVWWRNLQANPQVRLWIAGREHSAFGEVIMNEADVLAQLHKLCATEAMLARALGYDARNANALQKAARERVLVRLVLVS